MQSCVQAVLSLQKMTDKRKTKALIIQAFLALMLLVSLAGCDQIPFDIELPWLQVTQELPSKTATSVSTADTPEPVDQTTPTPAPPPTDLIIWLPPEMDPNGAGSAAELLKAKLNAFSIANDKIEVVVRIKNATGAGGLLDALTATSAAAPAGLPDLILLPRKDLETAAMKSLVYPLDTLTKVVDEDDWYPYAQDMALIQGVIYGIPLSGDALAMVYNPESINPLPGDWNALVEGNAEVLFAADDPQAALTTALYLAAGGAVQDNQRRPTLIAEPLTQVLKAYKEGVTANVFREQTFTLQSESQVWQAFENAQAGVAIVSVSRYLHEDQTGISLAPLPPISEINLTTGTGWLLAVSTPNPERQALATALAESLVEPAFMSQWTFASGKLPTRPSALESWQHNDLRTMLNQISMMAVVQPSNTITSSIGPILRDATLQVLRELVEPSQAAKVAEESIQ